MAVTRPDRVIDPAIHALIHTKIHQIRHSRESLHPSLRAAQSAARQSIFSAFRRLATSNVIPAKAGLSLNG
jgi:hypothetical protein